MEQFYQEVIGSRSFTSIWYWIVYALVWTRTTHVTLGAAYEDARLASVHGGQHQVDFEATIDIARRKSVTMFEAYGVYAVAMGSFLLAMIFVLGFGYDIQFMQAGFLLIFPLAVVSALSVQLAYRLTKTPCTGPELYSTYIWHRRAKQGIGAISILISSFWGVSSALFSPYA